MPTPECKAENGHVFHNGRDGTWSVMQGVDDMHGGICLRQLAYNVDTKNEQQTASQTVYRAKPKKTTKLN